MTAPPLLQDDASGGYRCERCQVVVTPVYRYIMNFCIQDSTGQHWLTAFDEEGQKIMGITADEMEALGGAEGNEEAKTAAVGAKVFQDYQFKVRAKMEDDRDGGKRLRGVCAGIEPVKYAKEARLLGDAIAQFGL